MKTAKHIIMYLIIGLMTFLLFDTYIEYDIAKRTYLFHKENLEGGYDRYKHFYKTMDEVIEIGANTYEHTAGVFKYRLMIESSIFLLILLLFFLNWRNTNHQNKATSEF
ncbi:MAG: hypothetical protein LBN27_02705 [Prevotellaceae bacterium]|jgi:hypothetical protein|nr:hypothetical protein [Prevotellaceae bacterium]